MRAEVATAPQPALGGSPGQFVFVMSTGILAVLIHDVGPRDLSLALLALAGLGYLDLLATGALSWLRHPAETRARLADPVAQLQLLTVAIGTDTLAAGLALTPLHPLAVVVMVAGGCLSLAAFYAVPWQLSRGGQVRTKMDEIGGLWMLLPVVMLAVAVAASLVATQTGWEHLPLLVLAAVFWPIGLAIWLPSTALVLGRLLLARPSLSSLRPSYWVVMGSAAIAAVAGTSLAGALGGDQSTPGLLVTLGAFGLWAVATGLLPVMTGFTVARFLHREQLAGTPKQIWVAVFPIAMYGTASFSLAHVLSIPWMTEVSRVVAVIAALVWLVELSRVVGLRLLSAPAGGPPPTQLSSS